MKKRGTIEIQFNWVFVMIAGGIILLLFATIGLKIKSISEDNLHVDIMRYLDEVLTGVETSVDSEHTISIAGNVIQFNCEEYSVSNSGFPNKITKRVIFSPESIEKEINSYTLYWTLPFKISHFLYLSMPRSIVVLINTDNRFSVLNASLPTNLNKMLITDINQFENQNYQHIVFVFLYPAAPGAAPALQDIPDKDVLAVSIIPSNTVTFPDGLGRLAFYQKKGDTFKKKGESVYINKETLLGSLYTGGEERYVCNVEKGLEHLYYVSKILLTRLDTLKAFTSQNKRLENCNYDLGREALGEIESLTSTNDLTMEKIQNLQQASSVLIRQNYVLQTLSCPLIY